MDASSLPLDDAAALEARNRQVRAVNAITRLLSSTLDLDERLQHILRVSMEAVGATAGSILLFRQADEKLVFQYVVGPSASRLTGFAMPAEDGVAGQVFQTGKPAITNHPADEARHRPDVSERVGFHTESILTAPLKYAGGDPVGVVQLVNKASGDFGTLDLEVLELVSAVAAAAIENARLHRDAQIAAVAHAVGDLSHDIKNKVTPISLSVDTLWPMMDELYTDLDRIVATLPDGAATDVRTATEYLRGFYAETFSIIKDQVKEIQDYTRVIADALKGSIAEPVMAPHDLAEMLTEQARALEPVARAQGVALAVECPEMPAFCFDRFLMERAVHNLVNNALAETPGGRVTVRAWQQPDEGMAGGEALVVEVADTGRGMPAHVLRRILRGEAQSTKPGGTGLGTRIVFNAVRAHNGRLEGESREGEGATFRVFIPARLEPQEGA